MTQPAVPVCPCDDHAFTPPVNPAGLDSIAFRISDYRGFRRALLNRQEGEQALYAWRPGGEGDLAVMMVEWWAYLADILTFYNERIAKQAYLRTADRPQSVGRLIRVLGYRPRPAIGARGVLAALVKPGQSLVLPKGQQFLSKPGPGQQVQTFELDLDTAIGGPDAAPARLVESLLVPMSGMLMLPGEVRGVSVGETLLLRAPQQTDNVALQVTQVRSIMRPDRTRHTLLTATFSEAPPAAARAADFRLERARQSSGLWTLTDGAIEIPTNNSPSYVLHLSGLARDLSPNDPVILTGPASSTPLATRVLTVEEVVWYANSASDPSTPPANNPLPILHARVMLANPIDLSWDVAAIGFAYNFGEAARLEDQIQDGWDGSQTALEATAPAVFRAGSAVPVLIEDVNGIGVAANATSAGDDTASLSGLPTPFTPLNMPARVFYNLLPISRGKTVANEVLGSGDARLPDQSFTLAKSPVTYLASGPNWASTVAVRVDGRPWREVSSFYGQAAGAEVFVTHEDESGATQIKFGDGVNGARLPTGSNNVVATYRIGAGAASPPAGKLTVLANPFPGLAAVRNPVAVGGGDDPDPPLKIRQYAPRSVLTFGRAVSVLDYEALAAQAPGVTRARAAWAWNETRQCAAVTVYVGDDPAALASATVALQAARDPNRSIAVVAAQALPTRLTMTLQVAEGMDPDAVIAAATQTLIGDGAIFTPSGLRVGQPVFDSVIAAAVLSADGAVAILQSAFATDQGAGFIDDPAPLHQIGEGGWFDLTADRIVIVAHTGGG